MATMILGKIEGLRIKLNSLETANDASDTPTHRMGPHCLIQR